MRNIFHFWIASETARATRLTFIALLLAGTPACAAGVMDPSSEQQGEDSGATGSPPDARASSPTLDGGNESGRGVDAAPATDARNEDGPPADQGGATDGGEADAGPSVLIGKWTFDEGSGPSSADLSGNGHAALLVGGASWAALGKEGSGLALNGTTAYADVGLALVDTSKSFSVLAWAKLAVVNSWEVLLSQDDAVGSLFGLKLRGDNNLFDFDVETSDVISPGFVVAQSPMAGASLTWVHLAGVYDSSGGTLKLYVDGVLRGTAPLAQSLLPSAGHFVVGRGLFNGATGSFLNGSMDDVEVYSGALRDAEVESIFASQQ